MAAYPMALRVKEN